MHQTAICIDSDGCAFDTMEIKHKECFCPVTIQHWNLQAVSRYAREAWEFVNLYSITRGTHRLYALVRCFELLKARREILEVGFRVPDLSALMRWLEGATTLSNETMREYCGMHPEDAVMQSVLAWSLEINVQVKKMVRNVPPFRYVRESLEMLNGHADLFVVSATPQEAVEREWQEHGIARYVTAILGQEQGTKEECIHAIAASYAPQRILMIGDAPGDHASAEANHVRFYPIRPGDEIACWAEFETIHSMDFLGGTYDGHALIERFMNCLPETPPWA